jgi:hypothetical protein
MNSLPFNAPFLEEDRSSVQERFRPGAIWSYMQQLWNKGRDRRKLWASIDMEMDCAPPYDEAELEEKGRGFQSNFSSRILEGDVNQAVSRYSFLLNSIENHAVLPIKINAKLPQGWGAQDIQIVLQNILNEAVRLWHEKHHTDICSLYDITKYGQCLYMNMGLLDWRDKRVPPANILLPDRASSVERNWDIIGIIDYLRVDQLVQICLEERSAKRQGWNPAGIMHMLLDNYCSDWKSEIFSWENALRYVQSIRTNSLSSEDITQGFSIPVIKVFIREYDFDSPQSYNFDKEEYFPARGSEENQISLYILPFRHAPHSEDEECPLIYRKRFIYRDFDDIFTVGQFMPHEFFWGSRGIGQMTLNFAVADSILQSGAMDAALAALEMRFIPQTNEDLETLENLQDSNILPPGTTILETSNYAKNIEVALTFSRGLQQRKALNLPQQAYKIPGAISPYETATGAQLRVAQETTDLTQQELRFWMDQDRRVRRQVRNLVRLLSLRSNNHYLSEEIGCKDIIDHIRERLRYFGLPENTFEYVNLNLVTSGRTFGRGTLQDQLLSFITLEKYLPALPPEAQDMALRGILTTLYGADNALRLVPPRKSLTRNEEQQIWEANQENAAIEAGILPYLRNDDMDLIHIAQHFNLVESLREQLQSNAADPIRILNALVTAQSHIFGPNGHVEKYLLRLDLKNEEAKRAVSSLSETANQLQQLIAQTESLAQQKLDSGQMTELEKAKLAELQTRIQRNLLQMQRMKTKDILEQSESPLRSQYLQTQIAYMNKKMME